MFYNNQKATGVAGNVATTLTSSDSQLKKVLYGQVVLTTDATVANRRVILSILDEAGDVVIDLHAAAVVAASTSSQHHEFLQGIYRETSFIGGAIQVPIPTDCLVPPGYSLKVSIENGVAGDSYNYAFASKVDHVVPGETVI